jgi:hypothetical protein
MNGSTIEHHPFGVLNVNAVEHGGVDIKKINHFLAYFL